VLTNKFQNILSFTIFLIVIVPIFINLNIVQGLRFDVNAYNILELPSIPISILLLSFLSLVYFRKLIINKKFFFIFLLMLIFLLMNFINGSGVRASIVFFGMLIPIISFSVFSEFLKDKNNYNIFYNALIFIFFLKLFTDVLFYGLVVTPKFIINEIMIYNYYDYFPFFYYLLAVLSLYNLSINYKYILSVIIVLLICYLMVFTDSRLYQFGLFFIPFLILMYKIVKLKLNIYFNTMLMISIAITVIVAISNLPVLESSLSERFSHWERYFSDFTVWNFLFPFYNDYRTNYVADGSFHNELLEQFSYFGVIIFYYYFFLIQNIFTSVNRDFKLYSFLLMFILVFGTLVQLNFSNPYIGVLFGLTFAILKEDKRIKVRKIESI
jgi:hypothetical protein